MMNPGPDNFNEPPIFGRIKKLGETAEHVVPPEPEEQSDDVDDTSDTHESQKPADPYSRLQEVKPPIPEESASIRPPAEIPESALNRISAFDKHKTLTDKSKVEFEEISEQKKNRDNSLHKYFPIKNFNAKTRQIFGCLSAALLIASLCFGLRSCILSLILSIVSVQVIRVFSQQKAILDKFGLFSGRLLLSPMIPLLSTAFVTAFWPLLA